MTTPFWRGSLLHPVRPGESQQAEVKLSKTDSIKKLGGKQIRAGDVLGHEEFWQEVTASRETKARGGKRKAAAPSRRK